MKVPARPAAPATNTTFAPDPAAWRLLWRVVGGGALGAALALVAGALLTSISQLAIGWIGSAFLVVCGAVVAVWLARPESPAARRAALAGALLVIGAAFGWEMERIPGAIVGAAAGGPAGWLLAWGLEWLLGRIATRWLCLGFWSLLAAVMTSAALALILKLVVGRLDDDDIAFHFTAIVAVVYLAGRSGWLAEPRADLAAVRDQLRRTAARLARSPLLPFTAAIFVAGLVAGPAHARCLVEQTATSLAITRDPMFVLWPAAIAAAAAWIAWRHRRSSARQDYVVLTALIWAGCGYSGYSVLAYRISADTERVTVHGQTIPRADLVRIDYERKTGRRFVAHQPILVLAGDRRVALDIDTGSVATAEFLESAWGVPSNRPK